MNTNHFLQTSMTITFIIQKNRESIPNFDAWYSSTVLQPWGSDEVMKWAKEARNTIEKEGDLDLNSSLRLTLIYSHLEKDDKIIEFSRTDFLGAGVRKLVRLAQKNLPSGVSRSASVKIERRWVTSSLPHRELLQSLIYVYARTYDCCKNLANHLNSKLDETIQDPTIFINKTQSHQTGYFKMNSRYQYSFDTRLISIDKTFKPDQAILDLFNTGQALSGSLENIFEYYSKMANTIFSHFGSHHPSLFIFNENWQVIDYISTQFSDQADKFIFWRFIADRIAALQAFGLVWIAESWQRKFDYHNNTAIRNMPIIGEMLHVELIDKLGNRRHKEWRITRNSEQSTTKLDEITTPEKQISIFPYFLEPALRALTGK
ncbi:MAG: hypothetical protein HQL56_13455 [Magnetococcales bacterium]|nr:hypothetical protein [Magnetococcales bacterium]